MTTSLSSRRTTVLAVLDAVMGVNALAGAWYALSGAPGVPEEWLEGTPFDSYRSPLQPAELAWGAGTLVAAARLP